MLLFLTLSLILGLIALAYTLVLLSKSAHDTENKLAQSPQSNSLESVEDNNPLKDRHLYIDSRSSIAELVQQKRNEGRADEANLLDTIANQPQVLWLTGPSENDLDASDDIALVSRTSKEAAIQQTLPVYQLYAIPNRDACAGYSKNGFSDNAAYIAWLERILTTLQSEAVFLIEADAVAHAVQGSCLNQQQTDERFTLLNEVTTILSSDDKVIAAYLDAGHSEWFPRNDLLTEPLKKAGVEKIRGIAVNTSFFTPTDEISQWAQDLAMKLGSDKAAVIDTSRNGNGPPPSNVTGEERWCNPEGRALGHEPTTDTNYKRIDAFLWIKRPGESDGSCRNNLPAGTLSETLALDLVRQSSETTE